MAMATFKSDYEKSKWKGLESSETASLDRLKTGLATPQDIKRLQVLISKYNSLATKLFMAGVQGIEISAKSRVDKVSKDRVAKGKTPLDVDTASRLLAIATNKAWDEQGTELVVIIEESIEKALKEQDTRTSSMFDAVLNKYSLNNPLGGLADSENPENIQDTGKPTSLLSKQIDKEMTEVKNNQHDTLDAINKLYSIPNGISKLGGIFGKINSFFSSKDAQSNNNAYNPKDFLKSKLASEMVHDVPISTSPKFEATVENSLKEESKTNTRIQSILDALSNPSKKKELEEDKASSWWRKLKEYSGEKLGIGKKIGIGLGAGLMVLLGKLLVTELLGGHLWEKIKTFLSSDEVKEFAHEFLAYIESGGKAIATPIADKLNPFHESNEGVIKKANTAIKDADGAIAHDKTRIAKAEEALKKDPDNIKAKRELEKAKKDMSLHEANKKDNEQAATDAQTKISSGDPNVSPYSTSLDTGKDLSKPGTNTGRFGRSASNIMNQKWGTGDWNGSSSVNNTGKDLSKPGSGNNYTQVTPESFSTSVQDTSPQGVLNTRVKSLKEALSARGSSTSIPNDPTSVNPSSFIFPKGETLSQIGASSPTKNTNRPPSRGTGAAIPSLASIQHGQSVDGLLGLLNSGAFGL